MARDTLDSRPVTGKAELVEWMAEGCKPEDAWRIGTEHEKFGFYCKDHSPVPYEGENGIRAVLEGMHSLLGWEGIYDAGNIIGLVDPTGGGAISLEPGGQFELSGAPLENLHQTCREVHSHLAQLREVAEPLGIEFLGLGASPVWSREQTPSMPKSRYDIMKNYMPKVGNLGLDMMFRSCTIQVNLDFSSEADMVKKMRVSLALQPVATAIFANSPFLEGKPNGFLSFRSEIWRDTDADRTGMLPFAFDDGFGFEAYGDWAFDIPMYFVKRGDTYHNMTHVTWRQFMNGDGVADIPDPEPTMGDWTNHLSTVFPEVRLKQFLEMRGADGGPWRRICALPAFWVGLLYDDTALNAAWDLVKDWSVEEMQTLRDAVPKTALKTPFRGGTVHDVARRAVEISHAGLKARNHMSADGDYDEQEYLAAVDETIARGETPAEEMLRRLNGECSGDLDKVFQAYSY